MLTMLYDVEDFRCLEAVFPEALRGTLLAFEVDLHVQLLERGIAHHTPWDVVAPGDLGALQELTDTALRFWDEHARVSHHGLNLLAVARYRHHCAMRQMVWMVFVIDRVLTRYRPADVVVFEEHGHGLQQPPGYRKMPMLGALLRGIAERRGLTVRVLSRPEDVSAGFTDQVARERRSDLPGVDLAELTGGRDWMLFCGNGSDLLRQLPIIRGLRDRDDAVVVQVYKSAEPDVLAELELAGHTLVHESQLTGSFAPVEHVATAAEARAAFDAARGSLGGLPGDLLNNPRADIHFDFVFGPYLQRVARHVRVWQSLFAERPPRLVLGNFALPVMEVAHHSGIACLELMHGLMVMGHVLNTLCLSPWTLGALSAVQQRKLIERSARARRIEVTGDPHVDRLVAARSRRTPDAETADSAGVHRVLLLTGNLGLYSRMDGLPVIDWAEAVRCFDELMERSAAQRLWKPVVKQHPRFDHPELYAAAARRHPEAGLRVLPDGPPADEVCRAAVVVVCNATTSALIEASMFDRPVWILCQAMRWYDPSDWGLQDWAHFDTVPALCDELRQVLSDASDYRRAVRQTAAAVERYAGPLDGQALQRCLRLIAEEATKRRSHEATQGMSRLEASSIPSNPRIR